MSKEYENHSLQNEQELRAFIRLLREENVTSYLEIGSKFGGSLWKIAQALPPGSRIMSVDLPGKQATRDSLEACVRALVKKGYDAHLLLADSTAQDTIDTVQFMGPYDACFIDANHTEPYVRKDWANYGPLCRIVAFHDIGYDQGLRTSTLPIDVPKVWAELKQGRKFKEIRFCQFDNGIGVLWNR